MADKVIIKLVCSGCKEQNYVLSRGKKSSGGGAGAKKLELKKFCSRCRQHTTHKEKR
jgi:large subunit ribosomal protein L33